MKDNRKNRNLEFIRIKNGLRLGKIKFSNGITFSNSIDINEVMITSFIDMTNKSLMNQYKLKLPNCEFLFGTEGEDFLNDTTTLRVTLSL